MYLTSLGEAFMGLSSTASRARLFFPKVVQWSVEVLGAWSFVSSPHATRKCRLLPEAQERGLTFVIRMRRLQPISNLQDTWRAWARRDVCCGHKRRRGLAATAALSADMVRRVGSSVWTWVWKLYVSFATALLIAVTIHM